MQNRTAFGLFLVAIMLLNSCKKKTDEPDLTKDVVGTWSYTYRRESSGASISQTGTMVVSRKTNSSVTIPFSEGKNRTFSISGNQLVQDLQTVQLSEIQGTTYMVYSFTEESTGTISGNTLSISGTARRADAKAYTFTVRATRK